MGLITQNIDQDVKEALKNKNQLKVSTLRMLKTALVNARIDKKTELTDDEEMVIVGREVKKREEAAAAFQAARRDVQAESESAEAEILRSFLPPQLSDEDLRLAVKEILTAEGLQGVENFGKAMSLTKPRLAGKVSGERLAQTVKRELA